MVMVLGADSRHKDNRCGEGARYFDPVSAPSARCGRRGCGLEARLLRKEQKLKLQTRTARSHRVSRDGGVQSYFVANTMRGASKPRYSVRFSSRRDFGKRLDVVKDRVTSPLEREVVGSIPTWSKHTCRC